MHVMLVVADTARERRRAQNRIAKRRFREKQKRQRQSTLGKRETGYLPEHEHALGLARHHSDRTSLPGPDDNRWPPERGFTTSQTACPSLPTNHVSTEYLCSRPPPVASYSVSKGALLTSYGLVMGNIDFLSFAPSQDLEPPTQQRPPTFRDASAP
ncbi:hypothetical protein N656DRAFT_782228 [Canariomyces notabilis]|uniref:BZIP domain-containing protein n=1 Tax=Canariomyces notabilis TaxID=2074819 RepID=A0AAN6QH69_9PEZI|nr:hypothetical protein N656DRAFT_782228 [Canariomyces arenarius]